MSAAGSGVHLAHISWRRCDRFLPSEIAMDVPPLAHDFIFQLLDPLDQLAKLARFLVVCREMFLGLLVTFAKGDLAINIVSIFSERVDFDRRRKRLGFGVGGAGIVAQRGCDPDSFFHASSSSCAIIAPGSCAGQYHFFDFGFSFRCQLRLFSFLSLRIPSSASPSPIILRLDSSSLNFASK